MDTFPLLVLLLSWRTEVEAQIKLFPENLTVLRGEKARFTCTPSNSQWTAMIWLLNGEVALTISNEHGVLQSPDTNLNLMAEKKKDGWMLVLNNTERHDQGEVTCDLQGIDRKTARLFVQEKGSVKILGNNRLAFQRDSVLFECEAAGWHPEPVLKWEVNNKEVSPSEYNISSEESRESLFTVTSNLSVLAAKSSHVDCLASVSALPEPLKSTISLKVGVQTSDWIQFQQKVPHREHQALAHFPKEILQLVEHLLTERLSEGRSSFERTSDVSRFSNGGPSLGRLLDILRLSNGNSSFGRTSRRLEGGSKILDMWILATSAIIFSNTGAKFAMFLNRIS
ncbi:immunoglobulin superfamily member 5 isoform X2 [Oreochromis aureus]|uniref:immunoglobulin superfamily member 5 isoform X2 n=1 Tax=Oreochromis aureus TaxID=47969 RepID=UPI001954A5F5|nr:immunoglobulin superfamily member 5 isoform X2 [Oreochromis aureus]